MSLNAEQSSNITVLWDESNHTKLPYWQSDAVVEIGTVCL